MNESVPEPLQETRGGSSTLRSINHLSQDFKSMLNYDFLIAALFYLSLSSTNKGAPEYGSLRRRRKSTVEGAAAASYSIPLTLVLGTYTNFCSKQGMLHSSAFNVGQEASKGENEVGGNATAQCCFSQWSNSHPEVAFQFTIFIYALSIFV